LAEQPKKLDPEKLKRLHHPLIHKPRPNEPVPVESENKEVVAQNSVVAPAEPVIEGTPSTNQENLPSEEFHDDTKEQEAESFAPDSDKASTIDVEYMIAEYDHPRGKEEEIELNEGDIVIVLERTSEDWFYVTKDTEFCGFIASNFLAEYTGEVPEFLQQYAAQLICDEAEELDATGDNFAEQGSAETSACAPDNSTSHQVKQRHSESVMIRERSLGSKIKRGIRKSLEQINGTQVILQVRPDADSLVVASPEPVARVPESIPLKSSDARSHIAQEILKTETYYVAVLNSLANEYKPTLLAGAQHFPNITEDDIKHLLNVDSILSLNRTILGELQNTIDSWNEESTIGDIFVRFTPFLKMYNQYAVKYNDLMDLYNSCTKDSFFVELTERVDAKTNFTSRMEALLIAPIQRVPRYTLLLMELRKNTPNGHKDAALLDQAIPLLQEVGNALNETVAQAANREKMMKMSAGGSLGLVKPHRKLIQEGVLTDGKNKKMHLILFSDMIIHRPESKTKKPGTFEDPRYQWPLHLVWVSDTSNKVKNSFSLTGPTTSYVLTGEDYKTWMMHIIVTTSKHFETLECTQGIQMHSEREAKMDIDDPKRYGTFTFPNKQKYSGWWINGLFDGYGRAEFLGDSYEGSWRLNQRWGQGIMTFINGNVYNGEWMNDVQNGFGVLTYENGDVYKGEWKNGVKNGKGEIESKCGASYSGDWKDDLPHGYGKMTYPDGMTYKGNWELGMRHGNGKYVFQNKDDYNGEWAFDLRNGKGIMRYADGRQFDGTWKDNAYNGFGVYIDGSGKYEGDWVNGNKDGTGTMRYKSGVEYKGTWKRGMYHGQGTITYKMGIIRAYIGEWANNKKHGVGSLQLFNDDVYRGHFKNNFMHGTGTYTFKNGITIKGKWVKGSLSNGDSTVTIPEKGDPTKKTTISGTHQDGRVMSSANPPIFLPTIPTIDILP